MPFYEDQSKTYFSKLPYCTLKKPHQFNVSCLRLYFHWTVDLHHNARNETIKEERGADLHYKTPNEPIKSERGADLNYKTPKEPIKEE